MFGYFDAEFHQLLRTNRNMNVLIITEQWDYTLANSCMEEVESSLPERTEQD